MSSSSVAGRQTVACLPDSLAAVPPFVWSRILFPGEPGAAGRVCWQALLLLLVLPGVLLYPCLSFHLFEPDEGRYAEIPREMLVRGDYIVPYLQGEPYLDKPPLLYWLVTVSYRIFGVHDWSARLVPALAIHACVLVSYLIGRRSVGERAAFWGALLLGLMPGFSSMGRLLVMDGLLSLWVLLALLSGFEAVRGRRLLWGWWLLAAGACGLGILTKGPIALLLLVPPLGAQRWLTASGYRIGWRALFAFIAGILIVTFPWYIAICLRMPGFAGHFLWQHNLVRFLAPFDHLEPVWYYIPIMLAGFLPGTLLAIPFCRFLCGTATSQARERSPEMGFMLLAGGWCLLFFSLSGCKLPTYVLPAYPLLALALGTYISRRHSARAPNLLVGMSFVILCIGHYVAVPWYARYRSPMGRPEEVVRYCSDRQTPVICYPRNCDSVAFYLARADLRSYRSKEIDALRHILRQQPRTIVLFTHRHSLHALRQALPPELRLIEETHFGLDEPAGLPDWLGRKFAQSMGETALGLCDMAVVERRNLAPVNVSLQASAGAE